MRQQAPHHSRLRRAAAGLVGAALLTLAGLPAAASHAVPSATGEPRPGTAQGPRGALLDAEPIATAAALPSARATYRVTYASVGARAQRIEVTGTVAVPRGKAPRHGWPVISWAHGTTGVADACAPSLDTTDGPVHDYVGLTTAFLDQWVRAGYAVVQTDYEGMGTPGDHPYMNGQSAANTVSDIVIAARHLDRSIGKRWVAMGHSQGGQAALFTAAQRQRARGLGRTDLLGAVTFAPGGVGMSQTVPYVRAALPGADLAVPFVPVLLIGAEAADPALDAEGYVTDAFSPILEASRTVCLNQIRQLTASYPPSGFPAASVFLPSVDVSALSTYYRAQEPDQVRLQVPTLVLQGTTDLLVSKPGIDLLVSKLCQTAPSLDYQVYPGADHRGVLTAGLADAEGYVASLFAGETTANTCPAG